MSSLQSDEPRLGPMSLLQAAESRLGPLTSWSSDVLKYMFFKSPTFPTIMRLVNFFYGNHVPCSLAIQLFQACNDNYINNIILEDFNLFYEAYERVQIPFIWVYISMCGMRNFFSSMGKIKINLKLTNLRTTIFLEALETLVTRKSLPCETKLLISHTAKKNLYIFIHYRLVMSLLQRVESLIGTVYSWPRLILKYLCCEPANYIRYHQFSLRKRRNF